MLSLEVLIRERFRAVDTRRARSITVDEIATLTHEILDLYPYHAHQLLPVSGNKSPLYNPA